MKNLITQTRESIRGELDALARGELRTWPQLSFLLQSVEDSEYWREEASSFTEWILKKTALFGVRQASLWRYLGAGRTYLHISESLTRKGDRFPSLWDLPESVSPENLELLSKISRVIPETELRGLFAGILKGNMRRSALRALWDDYRPTLDGKTARGRNVQPPRVDPNELRSRGALFEARTLDALRSRGPSWTGVPEPERFAFFSKVRTTRLGADYPPMTFDAVAVLKPSKQAVQYHGIAIRTLKTERLAELDKEIPYFDYYWLAVPAASELSAFEPLVDHIGVLLVDNKKIVVHRHPKHVPHEYYQVDGRLLLASFLLLRAMR